MTVATLFPPKRFKGTAADRPPFNDSRLYIGLFHHKSYLPGAEVSGNGYSRVSVSLDDSSNWRALDDGTFANAREIVFPRCESDWGTVRYLGLCRGLHGPPQRWIEINNPTHLRPDEQAVFQKGNLA